MGMCSESHLRLNPMRPRRPARPRPRRPEQNRRGNDSFFRQLCFIAYLVRIITSGTDVLPVAPWRVGLYNLRPAVTGSMEHHGPVPFSKAKMGNQRINRPSASRLSLWALDNLGRAESPAVHIFSIMLVDAESTLDILCIASSCDWVYCEPVNVTEHPLFMSSIR